MPSIQEAKEGGSRVKGQPGLIVRSCLKKKKAGGMDQAAQHLPSKCKALSLNPNSLNK
jgi:hypothetical protein